VKLARFRKPGVYIDTCASDKVGAVTGTVRKALANETGEKYGHRHHCIGDGHQFSAVPTICDYEGEAHVAHVPVNPFRVAERKSGRTSLSEGGRRAYAGPRDFWALVHFRIVVTGFGQW
jgi:hypothetical protein